MNSQTENSIIYVPEIISNKYKILYVLLQNVITQLQ